MSLIVPRFIFASSKKTSSHKPVKLETKYYSQEALSKYYKCETQKKMELIDCAMRHSRCLTCPYNNIFRTHPGGGGKKEE
jgi:hypothetical protein